MSKIAIVTGANQGLGYGVVQYLSECLGPDDIIYLTARSEERGKKSLSEIINAKAKVEFFQLDVTVSSSIEALSKMIKEKHGGIDIIVSNAAARISKENPQSEQVRNFINTNNHGSYALLKSLS